MQFTVLLEFTLRRQTDEISDFVCGTLLYRRVPCTLFGSRSGMYRSGKDFPLLDTYKTLLLSCVTNCTALKMLDSQELQRRFKLPQALSVCPDRKNHSSTVMFDVRQLRISCIKRAFGGRTTPRGVRNKQHFVAVSGSLSSGER